jgi:chromosome partitioning protein
MLASPSGPHVILLGNHKGGSGKSTLAMHVAIALLKSGHQVTTIDLDYEQRTLTRYFENRRISAMTERHPLDLPDHHCVDDMRERGERWSDSDRIDALEVLRNVHQSCDFILMTRRRRQRLEPVLAWPRRYPHYPCNDSFLDSTSSSAWGRRRRPC